MAKRNDKYRAEVIRSMDILIRTINNEDYIDEWFMSGVADGDINYQESYEMQIQHLIEYGYTDDDTLSEMMETFLRCMRYAKQDGGMYVDCVVSE